MNQKQINKKVNKIIKIIVDQNNELKESKSFVIDLDDRFLFYRETTKEIYTGKSILHKYKSLANETLKSSQIVNYVIGAKIEDKEINYILYKDKTIEDLNGLLNEIIGI